MMHLLLASFADTATNPFAIAFLSAGLLGSVAIGAGPSLRRFSHELPERLTATRQQALAISKDPHRAAAIVEAISQLPRAAISYGLLGLVLAAWAGYAFTQPATEKQPAQLEYISSFGYVARGAPSVAVPDGVVGPVSAETVAKTGGQPTLYTNVLSTIDFGFNYEMRAPQRLEVLASGAAALRIRAQDGWERTIMLQSNQPLSGAKSTMLFSVNLDAVRLVIAGVERTTGAKSAWYDLRVVPVVRMAGQMGAAHIDETYAEEFNLRYDPVRITPEASLSRTESKPGHTLIEMRHQVSAFGFSMGWGIARWTAALCAIVALGGAGLLVISRPAAGGAATVTPAAAVKPSRASVAPKADRPADAATPPVRPAPAPPVEASAASPAPPAPAAATSAPPASPRTEPPPPPVAPAADSPAALSAMPDAIPLHAAPVANEAPAAGIHSESDDLLAASVAPSSNGASHAAPHAAPPDIVEHAASADTHAPPAPAIATPAPPMVADPPEAPLPSPESVREAIARNLAESAELARLLADSVAAANATLRASLDHPQANTEPPAEQQHPAA
jgi:hypothetical protein